MAAGNTNGLKEKALSELEEGRRELHEEAVWLRHELDVKRIAREFTSDHLTSIMVASSAAGVALPWLVLPRDRRAKHDREPRQHPVVVDEKAVKATTGAYLGGMLLKMATPMLVKEGLRLFNSFRGFRHD